MSKQPVPYDIYSLYHKAFCLSFHHESFLSSPPRQGRASFIALKG